jgi:DNA-binding LacI/PurR family transcriptional regulator
VKFLADLGHRKIGYCTYEPRADMHFSIIDRRDGYIRAMTDAGLNPDVLSIDQSGPNELRHEQLTPWLSSPDRPTAVYAQSISEAQAVFAAAMACGLSVPGDLSILTNHHEGLNQGGISFDSLIIPTPAVGKKAVEMLGRRIAQPGQHCPAEAVPFYFGEWKRHSCGPCPQKTEPQ